MASYSKGWKVMVSAVVWTFMVLVFGIQQTGAAGPPKMLRIAFDAADIKSLDPGYAMGTIDIALQDMIFDGLLRFKPGNVNVVETDMVEKYEVSGDRMEMTFFLRKGIMTHPFEGYPQGVELTAEDVVFTIEKAANPKLSSHAGIFSNFKAQAIDKYTVRVKLEKRIPTPERNFIDYQGGQIIPKKAFEKLGAAKFKTSPVGTGPFRVANYIPGQKMILAAHDRYFRGRPRIDTIEVLFMADVNSREFALRRGEVDIIEGIREQPWIEKMKVLPGTLVDVIGPGDLALLSFNLSKKPMDNPLVRKALFHGLNLDELRGFIGADASGPACSVVPSYLPGGLTCEDVKRAGFQYKPDIQKAKDLLRQAGFPNGFPMEQTITEYALYRRPTENIQAQWKKIGVDLKLNVVDHPTYHTRIRQDVNPYVLYIALRPSADIWLTYFFHSDSIVVTGKSPSTNFSHCNIIDKLIESARYEVNKEKQIDLWKQAQYKLLEEAIAMPLYVVNAVWGRNGRVKLGYELQSTLTYYPQLNELTDIVK